MHEAWAAILKHSQGALVEAVYFGYFVNLESLRN